MQVSVRRIVAGAVGAVASTSFRHALEGTVHGAQAVRAVLSDATRAAAPASLLGRTLRAFDDTSTPRVGAIPRIPGLPVVGNALEFMTNPTELLLHGHERYGNMFSIGLGNQPAVVVLGPELNRAFFHETDKALSIRAAYPYLERMFRKDVYFFADPEHYRIQQGVLLPQFTGKNLAGYLAAMVEETEQFLQRVPDHTTLEAPRELGPLVMGIAAHALLGADFREYIHDDLYTTFRDFSGGIDAVLPAWAPLPRFRRSRDAKAQLHAMFQRAIDDRRSTANPADDFLQRLIWNAGEQQFDDELIRHLIMLLVWAGHETTVGHTAWAIADLLQHPHYLRSVLDEQARVLGDGPLTMENLKQLKRLEWGIRETERLHPVAYILARKAAHDFTMGGHMIPRDTMVMASPWVSHRMASVFSHPHVYDPERFSPERDEEQPYSVIGFGGGSHRCAGVKFAYQEMVIIITLLLRDFELDLASPGVAPISGAQTRWPQNFRIRMRRRTATTPGA